MAKKVSNLILRVSEEWKRDLQAICRNKGRSMTGHIEHSLKLAKLVTEYCDGNDDLDWVHRRLHELGGRRHAYAEPRVPQLAAAESSRAAKTPAPRKVQYKRGASSARK